MFRKILSINNLNNYIIKNVCNQFSIKYISSIHVELEKAENIVSTRDYLKIDTINERLCEKLSKHPIYAPIKDFRRIIVILRHNGIPSNDIIDLLPTKLVNQLETSNENWKSALDFLKSLGFNRLNRLKALAASPKILEGDNKTMNSVVNVLAMLRSFNLVSDQAQILIASNPLLLSTPFPKLHLVYQNLLNFFTKSDTQKLIFKSPTLLTDAWEITEKKIYYAHTTMGIPSSEISKSRYFVWSLREIITRHLFLERAGLFKTNKIKTSKSTSNKAKMVNKSGAQGDHHLTRVNPTATEIFNFSDKDFVLKICMMKYEDFEVFSQTLDLDIEEIELDLEESIHRNSRKINKSMANQTDDDYDDDGNYDADYDDEDDDDRNDKM